MEMEQKLDQLKDEIYRTAEENKGLKRVMYFLLIKPVKTIICQKVIMLQWLNIHSYWNRMWMVKECYLLC